MTPIPRTLLIMTALLAPCTHGLAAPLVPLSTCQRLVGPGALAPESSSYRVVQREPCGGTGNQGVDIGPLGSHSVISWNDASRGQVSYCPVVGWVANAFEFDSAGVVDARVSIDGWYSGFIGGRNQYSLRVQLLEEDGGSLRVLDERIILEKDPPADIIVDDRFAVQLTARLRPGHVHHVRLVHEAHMGAYGGVGGFRGSDGFDFGYTPGRGAGYDMIEVCLTPVEDLSDIRRGLADANTSIAAVASDVAAVNAKADEILSLLRRDDRDDIEWRLYQKDCLPSLWLPAAQGGKLERSRDLVVSLTDAAEASGARGPNIRLARQKLTSADAAITSGDFQSACWMLTEALRALTTP